MLAAAGPAFAAAAIDAREAGERGLARLAAGGLTVGMSYDHYAGGVVRASGGGSGPRSRG